FVHSNYFIGKHEQEHMQQLEKKSDLKQLKRFKISKSNNENQKTAKSSGYKILFKMSYLKCHIWI
ncbi:hypothetical protein, partial [Salmonella sp. s51884]|uniref:hypothetical protein n=1 Tax=Salmonella sp. s51884 TaxID=3159654 RepID=UPI00398002AE